jgi:HAD superfamily hydrolase (TIGR01509 family)
MRPPNIAEIAALCIDLDGTLVDSHAFLYKAFKQFMEKRGAPSSKEDFNRFIGPSLTEVLERVKRERGWKEDLQDLLEEYRRPLHILTPEAMPLFPGALAALQQFKAWNLKLAVVTSAHRRYTDQILRMHHLEGFFDAVITPEATGQVSKPNGLIFSTALKSLHVAPRQALAVEDSHTGVTAALNAEMPVCLLTHGTPPPHDAEKEGVLILKEWADLLALFRTAHV